MSQLATGAAPADTATVEVVERARQVFDDNPAIQVATLGGAWSPWILGAYFARAPRALWRGGGLADLDLVLMVERHGKSMANLLADPRVAFSVSKNDAAQDFIQGSGQAELLDDDAPVMAALVEKMPWYRLYTPCRPVRIAVRELLVTPMEVPGK